MKGTVKGNTIELAEKLPPTIQEGTEVEILIFPPLPKDSLYPIYDLGVKE